MAKSAYQVALEEKLAALIQPVLSELGCDLVELQFVQRKSSALLRILADRIGGVTLDECAEISRRASYLLEVEDPIEGHYTLEISSPGLDRPLSTPADFRRKVGETVRLFLSGDSGRSERVGKIVKVENDILTLETEDGPNEIALSQISKGKIVF